MPGGSGIGQTEQVKAIQSFERGKIDPFRKTCSTYMNNTHANYMRTYFLAWKNTLPFLNPAHFADKATKLIQQKYTSYKRQHLI